MTSQTTDGGDPGAGSGFGFAEIRLADLDAMTPEQQDVLPYGVVGLAADGTTDVYNASEAKLAGIIASTVIGWHYFSETAQCMNNYVVAQRFEDEPEIDDIIDYVLTLRMRRRRSACGCSRHRRCRAATF